MRVLLISDRLDGGIKRHVQTLRACLPREEVETYTIGEDEPFAGKNGHDIRELFQIRRVMHDFKPDIVHFHTAPFLILNYVKLCHLLSFRCRPKLIYSCHTQTGYKPSLLSRILGLFDFCESYTLPVSQATWDGILKYNPKAKGEVFYNPIRIGTPRRRALGGGGMKPSSSASSVVSPTRRTGGRS